MGTVEDVILAALELEWKAHAYCRPFSKCGPYQAAQVAIALREAGLVREWPLRINRDALADISTDWNFPFAVSDDEAWPELHSQLVAAIECAPPLPEGTEK